MGEPIYEVAYDVLAENELRGWLSLAGLAALVMLLTWFVLRVLRAFARDLVLLALLTSAASGAVGLVLRQRSLRECQGLAREGAAERAEGIVLDLEAPRADGGERFSVGGRSLEVRPFSVGGCGLRETGLVREGDQVRVLHRGLEVLRLEIAGRRPPARAD
jgi:hypothetical protein